jgi:hypothetical protein
VFDSLTRYVALLKAETFVTYLNRSSLKALALVRGGQSVAPVTTARDAFLRVMCSELTAQIRSRAFLESHKMQARSKLL